MWIQRSQWGIMTIALLLMNSSASAEDLSLTLRTQLRSPAETFAAHDRQENWDPSETAIIVCDVWDLHHCQNAVKRLEQFAPRLDRVLQKARSQGVTIIHSPSDCMDAYTDHAARKRAIETPAADAMPFEIEAWCSVIPTEERANYPIDQSDGGEDDDPQQHAAWAAKLKELGRNPNMPWKSQSSLITIDAEQDFISDRGDEVWNILENQGIRNVILTGVHVNMCVLGRPFGLRQMVRNGKNVVLMRDMTDAMYNPNRWPYVSHHEGTRRVISHIERYVCPTISSDQFLGGQEFRFSDEAPKSSAARDNGEKEKSHQHWENFVVQSDDGDTAPARFSNETGPAWYRCVIRVPQTWLSDQPLTLTFPSSTDVGTLHGWVNGVPLAKSATFNSLTIDPDAITPNDASLLVLKVQKGNPSPLSAPILRADRHQLRLQGRWQIRFGEDPSWTNMPLPAKFGTTTDIVFQPESPLFTAVPVTRPGEFTPGIEGPACDANGNVFAVNFAQQGTIGRVSPDGLGEVFVRLPAGSVGNGIRLTTAGDFFVADYTRHNILRVDAKTRKITVHAHEATMNQPNDIAIMTDGTLFASDPNWADGSGQIWRIDTDGSVTNVASKMGTTNGIEVSPDGKTLYVNESQQRKIWAFAITSTGELTGKRLVKQFEDHGFDGMRCDVDGNLYVTRYGKGTVVKLSPSGKILQEIPVLGTRPSNLCFGGPDGRTVYVTEVEFTRLVKFRVDRPGLSWSRLHKANPQP